MKVGGIEKEIWSDTELDRLRDLWPTGTEQEIQAAFPNRTWAAIRGRATKAGIRRRRVYLGSAKAGQSALIDDLIRARIQHGISQRALSEIIGLGDRNGINCYENDAKGFSVFVLIAWCKALGLELRALPVAAPAKKPKKYGKVIRFENFTWEDAMRWKVGGPPRSGMGAEG